MRGDSLSGGGSGGGGGAQVGAGRPHGAENAPVFMSEPEPEGLTLRDYLNVLWRRKWIIILVVAVATVSAFYFSYRQAKQYEASADLIYEKPLDISNPLTGQSYTNADERTVELSSVSSVLASPDMQKRANALLKQQGAAVTGYEVSAAPVDDSTTSSVYTSSNVARITVTSEDPELAKAAANAYADAYIAWRKTHVQNQISLGVDALKKELSTYEGAAKESTDYLVLQQRLQDLQLLGATAQATSACWCGDRARDARGAEAVAQRPPRLRRGPVRRHRPRLLARAVRHSSAAARGGRADPPPAHPRRIPRISKKLLGESAVVALTHPGGQAAEAFRLLRTNLEFMRIDDDVRSLLVTSCVQGEGKSVCVANLAVTLALGGKKVFVIDADLRRPRQHTYFGLDNEHGVSTVVTGQMNLDDALQKVYLEP